MISPTICGGDGGHIPVGDRDQPVHLGPDPGRQRRDRRLGRLAETRVGFDPHAPGTGLDAPQHGLGRRGPGAVRDQPQAIQQRQQLGPGQRRAQPMRRRDVRRRRGRRADAADDEIPGPFRLRAAIGQAISQLPLLARQAQHRDAKIVPARRHRRPPGRGAAACAPARRIGAAQGHQGLAADLAGGHGHVLPAASVVHRRQVPFQEIRDRPRPIPRRMHPGSLSRFGRPRPAGTLATCA